jgi:hypothetical protein
LAGELRLKRDKEGPMLKWILPASLLFACAPALAQTQAPAQQPQQAEQPKQGGIVFEDEQPAAKNKSANSRVICQDIREAGSRLASQRICMTAEQWKQQQEHDREMLAQRQQQSTNPGAPGN